MNCSEPVVFLGSSQPHHLAASGGLPHRWNPRSSSDPPLPLREAVGDFYGTSSTPRKGFPEVFPTVFWTHRVVHRNSPVLHTSPAFSTGGRTGVCGQLRLRQGIPSQASTTWPA